MDAEMFGQIADEKDFWPELDQLIYLALSQPSWTRSGWCGGLCPRNCWWELWKWVRKLCG
jgi:hypothetical protein